MWHLRGDIDRVFDTRGVDVALTQAASHPNVTCFFILPIKLYQHKGVPKFGSWEDEDRGEHLYTQYFENARKGKSQGAVRKPKDDRRSNREDDLRQHETTVRKPYAESPNHRYRDHTNYDNAVRKTGIEKSPVHKFIGRKPWICSHYTWKVQVQINWPW
uniref:RIN4 pathogenic type III effector avirulence factor Avr cleavage site domain-containing protein n=1 Tax=Oryza sativa subsp. japonica TaxID=39947 RepID=Q852D1_ORYSJ|nr:hypothetical protein [Oryza sativa Japonica Group]